MSIVIDLSTDDIKHLEESLLLTICPHCNEIAKAVIARADFEEAAEQYCRDQGWKEPA